MLIILSILLCLTWLMPFKRNAVLPTRDAIDVDIVLSEQQPAQTVKGDIKLAAKIYLSPINLARRVLYRLRSPSKKLNPVRNTLNRSSEITSSLNSKIVYARPLRSGIILGAIGDIGNYVVAGDSIVGPGVLHARYNSNNQWSIIYTILSKGDDILKFLRIKQPPIKTTLVVENKQKGFISSNTLPLSKYIFQEKLYSNDKENITVNNELEKTKNDDSKEFKKMYNIGFKPKMAIFFDYNPYIKEVSWRSKVLQRLQNIKSKRLQTMDKNNEQNKNNKIIQYETDNLVDKVQKLLSPLLTSFRLTSSDNGMHSAEVDCTYPISGVRSVVNYKAQASNDSKAYWYQLPKTPEIFFLNLKKNASYTDTLQVKHFPTNSSLLQLELPSPLRSNTWALQGARKFFINKKNDIDLQGQVRLSGKLPQISSGAISLNKKCGKTDMCFQSQVSILHPLGSLGRLINHSFSLIRSWAGATIIAKISKTGNLKNLGLSGATPWKVEVSLNSGIESPL